MQKIKQNRVPKLNRILYICIITFLVTILFSGITVAKEEITSIKTRIDGSQYVAQYIPQQNGTELQDRGNNYPLKYDNNVANVAAADPPNEIDFNVYDTVTKKWITVTATLNTTQPSASAYLYVEKGKEITIDKLKEIAEGVDKSISFYSANYNAKFPDKDGYAKIFILILDIPTSSGIVYGYFSPNDQKSNFPINLHSNEKDMLYIDRIHGDNYTIAHELTHMSVYYYDHDILGNSNEELWLNEGLATVNELTVFNDYAGDVYLESIKNAFQNKENQTGCPKSNFN